MKWLQFYFGISGRNVVFISLYEHIGDIIACEPIINHLKNKYPKASIIWIINKDYAELLEVHPAISRLISLQSLSQWILVKRWLGAKPFIYDLHLDERRCTKYGLKLKQSNMDHHQHITSRSLLASFALHAGLNALNDAPVFWLNDRKKISIPSKPYIVVHTSTNGNEKDWTKEKWNELTALLMNRGFIVAEVGIAKQVHSNDDLYVDYTGKRSLQAIGHLIKNCRYFVGLDSAFAHMANALNKQGCVLIGNYTKGRLVYNRFNPFTGLYANASHILHHESPVAGIDVKTVYEKVRSDIHEQAINPSLEFVNSKVVSA